MKSGPGVVRMSGPARASVPVSASVDAVRAVLARLDPDNRLGSRFAPLFLAADQVLYLGLTVDSEQWLSDVAGHRFADARRAELTAALGGHLPDDPAAQVLALLGERRCELELSVLPVGLGAGGGTGFAYSADHSGQFRPGGTGTDLLIRGGADLAPMLRDKPLRDEPWRRALVDVLAEAEAALEQPVRVDFVVERERLWVIGVTPVPLSGEQALKSAAARGLSAREAVQVVRDDDLAAALTPDVQVHGLATAARGLGVSPGMASGTAVHSSADAIAMRSAGGSPILFLPESRPEDLDGLLASVAVVTQRGGRSSHAAVVARGLGLPCVTALTTVECPAQPGDKVTVDGRRGLIYHGSWLAPVTEDNAHVVDWLMDALRDAPGPAVRVNADTPADAARGRRAGAAGVGLCRIEHMFLGGRQALMQQVLLCPPGAQFAETLREIERIIRDDLIAMLSQMDGLPVVVRLLDPPRHEFLPDLLELTARADESESDLRALVRRSAEHNPMLGIRGVRMGLLLPALLKAQVRALLHAVAAVRVQGGNPVPELLIPMVSTPSEVDEVRAVLGGERIPLGVMIETPRAALLAGDLAERTDFFSIGTNDLSALTWGLSRDDAELELLPAYQELGLVTASPFEELDVSGVGRLIRQVIDEARVVRPDFPVGVCGEHAADASAVRFFAEIGVDYVSCSPPGIPGARLAAARAGFDLERRLER